MFLSVGDIYCSTIVDVLALGLGVNVVLMAFTVLCTTHETLPCCCWIDGSLTNHRSSTALLYHGSITSDCI